jgi:hypothetical protein
MSNRLFGAAACFLAITSSTLGQNAASQEIYRNIQVDVELPEDTFRIAAPGS